MSTITCPDLQTKSCDPLRSQDTRGGVGHPIVNRGEVTEYSDGLLQWWKANNPTISSWAKAARIVFALTITSATSERVFSLVKSMYGKGHDSALADELQGSVDAAL